MVARARTRAGRIDGGSYSTSTQTFTAASRPLYEHTCRDNVPGGGGLQIEKSEWDYFIATGSNSGITYQGYVLPGISYGSTPPPSLGIWEFPKLRAITNPSRPDIDLPVFIAELRDLPRILEFLRERGPRFLASANLSYQFGIRPLVNDLLGLIDITQRIEHRKSELRKLFRVEGLRMKRILDRQSTARTRTSDIINTSVGNIYGSVVDSMESVTWGTARWEPLPGYNTSVHRKWLEENTYRVVLGLNPSLEQVWELMPWSWLIDYFSIMGDVIATTRNFVQARNSRAYVMKHIKYKAQAYVTRNNARPGIIVSGTPFHSVEYKYRWNAPGILDYANVRLLTARQSSIIASLFIMRNRKLFRV